MERRRRIPTALGLVVIGLPILLIGCSGGGQQEFGRADTDAIRKLTQDFAAAYNAKDVDKVLSFFSGSVVLMPPNSSTIRGKDSIGGYFKIRFAEGATDIVLDPKDLGGHGPLGFVGGTFTLKIKPPGGGVESNDRGKFLWIARHLGGQWLIESVTWSSDLPPVAPVTPEKS